MLRQGGERRVRSSSTSRSRTATHTRHRDGKARDYLLVHASARIYVPFVSFHAFAHASQAVHCKKKPDQAHTLSIFVNGIQERKGLVRPVDPNVAPFSSRRRAFKFPSPTDHGREGDLDLILFGASGTGTHTAVSKEGRPGNYQGG